MNCQKTKNNNMQYKATYIENWKKWNIQPVWQLQTDFKNAKDKISKFHKQHFDKLTAPLELINNQNLI